jgi:hypothetical protein
MGIDGPQLVRRYHRTPSGDAQSLEGSGPWIAVEDRVDMFDDVGVDFKE